MTVCAMLQKRSQKGSGDEPNKDQDPLPFLKDNKGVTHFVSATFAKGQLVMKAINALIRCCLVFVFILAQPLSLTHASSLVPDPEKIYEMAPPSHFSESELPVEEREMLQSLITEPVQVTLEMMALMKALGVYVKRLEAEYGTESVLRRITSREEKQGISVVIDGVGKAELKALGVGDQARVFTRIVHFKTQNAYLFLNQEEISLEYLENHEVPLTSEDYEKEKKLRAFLKRNLKQYIAIQLLASGSEKYPYESIEEKDFDPVKFAESLPLSEEVLKPEDFQLKEETLETQQKRQNLLNKAWETFIADESDHKKTQMGRNTVVVWYKHTGVEKTKTLYPPRRMSLRYWQEYWNKIWERPAYSEEFAKEKGLGKSKVLFSGDYAIGLGSATAQSLFALGMTYAITDGNAEMSYTLPVLSLIWGGVIGVFVKTYRNIIYTGSHMAQTIKGAMVSLSFSYTYILLTQGADAVFALNMAAAYTSFHLLTNNWLTNWAKTWWNQFTRNRVNEGQLLDNFTGEISEERMKKFEKWAQRMKLNKTATEQYKELLYTMSDFVKQARVEKAGAIGQTYYFGSFMIKLFDLIDKRFDIPLLGDNIPLGRILFVASIPLVRLAVIKHAEHHNLTVAPKLRQDWENDKLLGIPYLNLIRKQIPQLIKKLSIMTVRIPARGSYLLGKKGVELYKKFRDPEVLDRLHQGETYGVTFAYQEDSDPRRPGNLPSERQPYYTKSPPSDSNSSIRSCKALFAL